MRSDIAWRSAICTAAILFIIEEILFWNIPRNDFQSILLVRINLFSVLAFVFVFNWIFISIGLRGQGRGQKAKTWSYSLLITSIILAVLFIGFLTVERHIKTGEPWPRSE